MRGQRRLRQAALVLVASTCCLRPVGARAAALATPAEIRPTSWQFVQVDRVSCGYSDNLLLSPFAPLRSTFVEAAAEILALRSFERGWEFSAFLQGEFRKYQLNDPLLRSGNSWFSRADCRWSPRPWLRLSLGLAAFGESSVIDFSETEATRLVVAARLRGVTADASVRLALSDHVSVQFSTRPNRTNYLSFNGDFATAENRARLEWRPSRRITTGLDWTKVRRNYADRAQYTAGGRPVVGTQLSFWQSAVDANVTLALEGSLRRALTVSVGQLTNQDRASGYFDYVQQRGGFRLDWSAGRWTAALEGQLRRDSYPVQTGGTGINPPPRQAQHLQAELRAERILSRRWSALVAFGRDRAGGNLEEFNYIAHTTSAGLRCSF